MASDLHHDLIGDIYDCALDPQKWQATLGRIADELGCFATMIYLVDYESNRVSVLEEHGHGPYWAGQVPEWSGLMVELNRPLLSPAVRVDEPLAFSRVYSTDAYRDMPMYLDWGRPQGMVDSIQTIVLRESRRLGIFGAAKHERAGFAEDRDIATLRFLAPHIRRSVTIGDLFHHRTVALSAASAALDLLEVGVVVTDVRGAIIHANAAAQALMRDGGLITRSNGRLRATSAAAAEALEQAVVRCGGLEIGADGIGVVLGTSTDTTVVAHVLPLTRNGIQQSTFAAGVAAIFISASARKGSNVNAGVTAAYAFTPAETRIVQHLVDGKTLSETAEALGVANSTVRSHLLRIFTKTGVSRQSELIDLIHRLTPPIRRA